MYIYFQSLLQTLWYKQILIFHNGVLLPKFEYQLFDPRSVYLFLYVFYIFLYVEYWVKGFTGNPLYTIQYLFMHSFILFLSRLLLITYIFTFTDILIHLIYILYNSYRYIHLQIFFILLISYIYIYTFTDILKHLIYFLYVHIYRYP